MGISLVFQLELLIVIPLPFSPVPPLLAYLSVIAIAFISLFSTLQPSASHGRPRFRILLDSFVEVFVEVLPSTKCFFLRGFGSIVVSYFLPCNYPEEILIQTVFSPSVLNEGRLLDRKTSILV